MRAAKINYAFIDRLHRQILQLPSPQEAPRVALPTDLHVMISEQPTGEGGWTVIYEGSVSSTKDDMREIEATAPLWLLESLLSNKPLLQNTAKISFMVTPWNKGDVQDLPELLNKYVSRRNARLSLTSLE